MTSSSRAVDAFQKIRLAGVANVEVHQAASLSVTVQGPETEVENTTTTVRGGTLVIGRVKEMTTTGKLLVSVEVPNLTSIELAGAGNIDVTGLKCRRFTARLSGAGNAKVSGKADAVRVELSGAGNVDAQKLIAMDATVKLTGVGNVDVYASDVVNLTLTGPGNIRYYGKPKRVNQNSAPVGSIVGH